MTRGLSRRTFLTASGATVAATSLIAGGVHTASAGTRQWTEVSPVDLAALSPGDFADDELDLPYHLAHLAQVANAVVEDGENRGFIDIHVWRDGDHQIPEYIRIMENILSLAFFYVTDRPWNVYRHSEPLRDRLEAALTFWVNRQDENGMFVWDGGTDFGGPYTSGTFGNTAFATKFMGETLVLLNGDETLDADLYESVLDGQRASLDYVLTDTGWYEFVRQFPNQYTTVWAGGLSYLHVRADAAIEERLLERMAESPGHFQSPAGYFYEGRCLDWGYTFGTHSSNVRMARHYALQRPNGDEFLRLLDAELESWTEFLTYNAVLEPDGGYVLNRAVETRQERWYLDRQPEPGAEVVRLARAFAPSPSEFEAKYARERAELEANWPTVPPLEEGDRAYSPYTFLHRAQRTWYPTDQERQDAIATLPYVERNNFIHQRADDWFDDYVFTYARRPSYYAVFNAGKNEWQDPQRFGLGLMWNDELGAVLQSQSRWSSQGVWGTRRGDGVYEADGVLPEYYLEGEQFVPTPGTNEDLAEGLLRITYDLRTSGRKEVRFRLLGNNPAEDVYVRVTHSGTFDEDIPLVYYEDTDELELTQELVRLRRPGIDTAFVIRIEGATATPQLRTTQTHIAPQSPGVPVPWENVDRKAGDPSIGNKKLATVRLTGSEELKYYMSFE